MTVKETAAFLRQHDNYLILTHKRPDGDTIGCAAALCEGLRALGRTAWICPHTEETHLFTPYLEGRLAPEGYVPETVVSVDIAARSLFTWAGEPWLARGVDLAIDHHPSQAFFAAQTCLDAGRAACGELIYDILRELGPITPAMAVAVGRSSAKKLLLPVNHCNNVVAGTQSMTLSRLMDETVELLRAICREAEQPCNSPAKPEI